MSLTPLARLILSIGASFMFAAVALGAFGAHALKRRLSDDLLNVYQTGVQYHFYHALGLLLLGLTLALLPESRALRASAWLMSVGILLFSGSLYALALSGVRWLGAITPLGGLAFLAAWACYVFGVLRG